MDEPLKKYLKNLGFLYFAYAHLTDQNLEDVEIESIKMQLLKRSGDEAINIDQLIDEIIHWYNTSADKRFEVINSIAGSIHFDIKNTDEKKSILQDLVSIGESDSDFSDIEKEFIGRLSAAWEIDFQP